MSQKVFACAVANFATSYNTLGTFIGLKQLIEERNKGPTERPESAPTDLKTEILSSIKTEMTTLFQNELATVIAKEFGGIKDELMLTVRSEIASCVPTG